MLESSVSLGCFGFIYINALDLISIYKVIQNMSVVILEIKEKGNLRTRRLEREPLSPGCIQAGEG